MQPGPNLRPANGISNPESSPSTGTVQRPSTGSAPNAANASTAPKADLGERVEQAIQKAKNQSLEQIDDARERTESALMVQRKNLSTRVRRVGDALHSSSEQLRRNDPTTARYIDAVSQRMKDGASYLERTDVHGLVRDVEDFARERPGLFFGTALAIGFVAGRFLKSSAPTPESSNRSLTSSTRSTEM